MTYREIVYSILDLLKLASDDTYFTEEHIIFLAGKYRNYLLKQYYEKKQESEIQDMNYQEICLDLEPYNPYSNDGVGSNEASCMTPMYLRSKQKIPPLSSLLTRPRVSTVDSYSWVIQWVNMDRFKFVGENKYLRNFLYCAYSPDGHIYLKSPNSMLMMTQKIKMYAIFDDPEEAAKYSCDGEQNSDTCDILDKEFPIENHLTINLIQGLYQLLANATQAQSDQRNNANDDLSDMMAYIRSTIQPRSNLGKQLGLSSTAN